jgi:hypothetical protein
MPARSLIRWLAFPILVVPIAFAAALLVFGQATGGTQPPRASADDLTDTPTATSTPTPPLFDLWLLLSGHHPSPAISGQDKTWTLFVENSPVSSCYPNCPYSPPATLHVSLTGQADSEFTFYLGPMPSGYPHLVDVTSLVTEPPGGLVTMSASVTTDDPYPSIFTISASDSVIAATPTPTVTATATSTPTPCVPPANDDFANGAGIGAVPYAANLSTACATSQVNEPQPCASIGSTVWYSYTPSETETLQADTIGSHYDTALAVYTGTDLGSLSNVACDDDSGPGLTSLITFTAVGGTTYHFQVGGFAGSAGDLSFGLAPPAPTPTPTDTPTSTPTAVPGEPTVTPTPTSIRPLVNPHIDKTVDGQQGPITVTLGDSVTYRWVITGDRYFWASVDDDTHNALDGECYADSCDRTAVVTLLTPGPITNTVHAEVCGIPPSVPPECEDAWDYVKVIVITPTATPTPAPDSDGDGCTPAQEAAIGFDDTRWYDFFDVPVSANPDMTPNGPKDQTVTMSDALAVLLYVGTHNGDGGALNPNGVAYDAVKGSCDWDADTTPDKEGFCYDRSPSALPDPPWDAGPPDDAITMSDVLAALAQVGLDCSGSPPPTPTSTPTPIVTPTATPTPNPAAINAAIQATIDLVGYYTAVVSVEPVDWGDTCLDLPKPGEVCLMLVTPGYRITIAAGPTTFIWHTNEDGSDVRLEE